MGGGVSQLHIDSTAPAAVLCPLDEHMGLDIARSLSSRGVRVWAVDTDLRAPGRHSNACTFVHCPHHEERDEQAFVEFLVEFGRSLGSRAVLYPLSDRHVLLFSQYREALLEHYEFVMPTHERMVELTTKDGLDSVSRKFNLSAPRTWFLERDTDIDAVANQASFPSILKPTESTYWHTREISSLLRKGLLDGRAKVVLCATPEELISAHGQIARLDPRMIVQEVIPGDDSQLVYAPFYISRSGEMLGYFAGRKHRVIPTGFGSASFVETFADPAFMELVARVLAAVEYRGLGGLEFKQDPRDGEYKLIEVNTRFGMWDGLGVHCGVDLPWISYCDAVGLPVQPQLEYRSGVTWIDWQRDVRAFIDYRRRRQLTFDEWRASVRGVGMQAIFSRTDPKPGVAYSAGLVGKLGARMMRRIADASAEAVGRRGA